MCYLFLSPSGILEWGGPITELEHLLEDMLQKTLELGHLCQVLMTYNPYLGNGCLLKIWLHSY